MLPTRSLSKDPKASTVNHHPISPHYQHFSPCWLSYWITREKPSDSSNPFYLAPNQKLPNGDKWDATMENENEDLDCTLTMRRYILKTKQSAWSKSSRRIIVWSTLLVLPSSKNAEFIPVLRHYPKQSHQDVRFICTDDIEKDSCTVYKRERIETTSRAKNTHGVALVDSLPGLDFTYKRGDRLWLYTDSQKPADIGTQAVPVINLRTHETGSIFTQHVCWYPFAKGPLGELWTFGGMILLVRGEKTQSWVFAVIQSRNRKATVCDTVQLTSDFEIKVSERSVLFKERLELMENQLKEASRSEKNILPTTYISMLKSTAGETVPIGGTRRMLDELKIFMELTSPSATSSSQTSPSSKRRRLSTLSSTPPMVGAVSRAHSPMSGQPDRHVGTNCMIKSHSSAACRPPSPTVDSVSWSLFSTKPLDKPFLAADEIAQDPTMIRAAYERARRHAKDTGQIGRCGSVFCPKALESKEHVEEEIAKLIKLCSNRDPSCPYTEILPPHYRESHIHLPASKCQIAHDSSHTHCVALRNFPGPRFSGCLLANWPQRLAGRNSISRENQHTCCAWTERSLASSDYDLEVEKAKAYVHPSNKGQEIVDSKGNSKMLMPGTSDRRPLIRHPDVTPAQVEDAKKHCQLLAEARILLELHGSAEGIENPDKSSRSEPLMTDREEPENLRRGSLESYVTQQSFATSQGEEIVTNGISQERNITTNIVGDFPPGFTVRKYDNTSCHYWNWTGADPEHSWAVVRASQNPSQTTDVPMVDVCDGIPVSRLFESGFSSMESDGSYIESEGSYRSTKISDYAGVDRLESELMVPNTEWPLNDANYLGGSAFMAPAHLESASHESMSVPMEQKTFYPQDVLLQYGYTYKKIDPMHYAIPAETFNQANPISYAIPAETNCQLGWG